jgi:hypothetical protein
VAGFKSERWPDIDRNAGRLHVGIRNLADAVTLDNWIIGIQPNTNQTVFWGEAVGHPILGNRHIVTSPILWISKDRRIARTLSRWYRLGEPAPLSIEPMRCHEADEPPEPAARA